MVEPIQFVVRYSLESGDRMVPNIHGSWCKYEERFKETTTHFIPRYQTGSRGVMIQTDRGQWCVYDELFEKTFSTARENTKATGEELILHNYFGKRMLKIEPSEAKIWKGFQIDLQIVGDWSYLEMAEGILNGLESRLEAIEASGYSILSVEQVKQDRVPRQFRVCFLVIARKNKQCHLQRRLRLLRKRYRS